MTQMMRMMVATEEIAVGINVLFPLKVTSVHSRYSDNGNHGTHTDKGVIYSLIRKHITGNPWREYDAHKREYHTQGQREA